MVKWSRYRPGVAQRVGRSIALLFHDRGTRRGWVVSSTPRPHFTPGKDPVPIVQEAGWPQGRFGRAENLVPTGIRSRTIQPVVSRYTDWATGSTYCIVTSDMFRHWCGYLQGGECKETNKCLEHGSVEWQIHPSIEPYPRQQFLTANILC